MPRIPTAIKLEPFEQAVLECEDCRIYEAAHYDQWIRRLGLKDGDEVWVYMLRNGMTMDFGLGPVPLWSDYVLCAKHAEEARD